MAYLLDANIFIQAKRLQYGFDFCPAFWDWLVDANDRGIVYSIDAVGDELRAGDDDLADWAVARGPAFFRRPPADLGAALGRVSAWVMAQEWQPAAQATFFQGADYFLIAEALQRGDTVVTHEQPANSRKRIKIPNVCLGMSVKVMNPYQMLRVERARFVLGESP